MMSYRSKMDRNNVIITGDFTFTLDTLPIKSDMEKIKTAIDMLNDCISDIEGKVEFQIQTIRLE